MVGGALMSDTIEAIYDKGVLIPTRKLEIPERSRVVLRIESIEPQDDLKLVSYIKLLKEGEDAEELFKV